MKIAQLHDGQQLAFPPETPDAVVEQTVRRLLGVPEPAPPAPPDNPTATSQTLAASAIVDGLKLLGEQVASAAQKEAETLAAGTETTVQAVASVAAILEKRVAGAPTMESQAQATQILAQAIMELAGMGQRVEHLNASVDNLSATILEATQAVIQTLLRPKQISYSDGNPTAIRPV